MEMRWGRLEGTGNRGRNGLGCEAERGERGTGVRNVGAVGMD